jgi:hypothetical protein
MWQGSGAIRRMLKEVALKWHCEVLERTAWAMHFSNAGN